MAETKSTCPYCGVGCGVVIEHDGAQITGVRGDPGHPANFGRLCTKGSNLHLTATPVVIRHQRLHQPMKRATRGARPAALGWEQANREIAERLLAIRAAHGPDSIGIYISGQLLTEDYHAFNKLARAVIGTPHIDSNSRLCMSSAVVGYKQTLGADAPPCSYEDIELADCVLISGANPAWAHPILFRRLEAARANKPGHKLIVIDPRRTETAELADLHLQLRPGTDVALCHGLLHAVIWQGWTADDFIAAHTAGFDTLKALVRDWTPARTAQVCGLNEADIWQAAEWFATSPASLSLYCQGLNQSSAGTAKNTALINLHLATGQIAKPGAGPFSLTGQPNAMGGRESGGMATLLPGHRDPGKAEDWADMATLWNVPDLPGQPGHTAVEMFEAAARGEIRALWIACTNPAQSMPDQAVVRRALERCELVILQEAFAHTATARYADYLLPAATWGEKEGTVTNSERRISRVRPAVPPPGEARADWRIAHDIAALIDAGLGRAPRLNATSAEDLWLEHRAATRGRDLDISGLSWATLDADGPQQWPYVTAGTPRLYTDGRFATADGRARFVAKAYLPPAEAPGPRLPFELTTGRMRDQWHGMSRSGSVPGLFAHEGRPAVRLHPADAARRKLAEGELVTVRSRRGELVLPLRLDANVPPAGADIAMHWGEEFIGAQDGVNAVTHGAFCPDSRQPELKFSAVAIEPAALPWRLSACAWVAPEDGAALREQLRALMPRFDYAHCLPEPSRGARVGWCFEAACVEAPAPELIDELATALGLDGTAVLRYADAQRGRLRLLNLDDDDLQTAPLQALLRVGQHDEGAWLVDLWRERTAAASVGRWLLSPGAPPTSMAPASPQVCNCFDVREDVIRLSLARCSGSPAERLAQLQAEKRCGTQCGSCLPALRRLVATTPEEATA
ncbi:nitrate reductase [Roseateles saccharophilus]|uniref:Assimilatory nitrate reductase (NADH) alpha subunit apoprotein n=1 Tax=Roseateles saccharophilus TaxID=304 RepID=A0A4R3VC59_ROSSA|nr:nitrate reductase [Roseateles saccharophilus]MDG0831838.1 nitrate reductase [Roseateles saccharophilus]TCV01139.1 assimilatory nitrate reductase (NADH) alpha subunit apoprotein [Roseateles saccharophilus]